MGLAIEDHWNMQGRSLFTDTKPQGEEQPNDNQSSENSDVANYRHWVIGGPSQVVIPGTGTNGLTQLDVKNAAHLDACINSSSYSEMSVPLNPYLSNDPFMDSALDLSNNQSSFVKVTYQSNHDAILKLRQSCVHGGSYNLASLPANPIGFPSLH